MIAWIIFVFIFCYNDQKVRGIFFENFRIVERCFERNIKADFQLFFHHFQKFLPLSKNSKWIIQTIKNWNWAFFNAVIFLFVSPGQQIHELIKLNSRSVGSLQCHTHPKCCINHLGIWKHFLWRKQAWPVVDIFRFFCYVLKKKISFKSKKKNVCQAHARFIDDYQLESDCLYKK